VIKYCAFIYWENPVIARVTLIPGFQRGKYQIAHDLTVSIFGIDAAYYKNTRISDRHYFDDLDGAIAWVVNWYKEQAELNKKIAKDYESKAIRLLQDKKGLIEKESK